MVAQLKRVSTPIGAIGVVALLAALAAWGLRGGQLDIIVDGLLAVGVLGVALYVIAEPETVRRALTGRTARYGSNTLIMSVAFIGILALVNFLASRYLQRFDLTQSGRYSLSAQTLQILGSLQVPVHVTGYYTPRYPQESRQEAEDLLKEYKVRSNGKLDYEFVDPELKPAQARQAGITRDGTLLFTSGSRRQEVTGSTEADLTSAIVKVTRETQKKVYFLTGHGERSIEDGSQQGMSQARQGLERDNYKVLTFNTAVTSTLPSDMDVLVIAGPTKPLLDEERQRISNYLVKGGRALILGDPTIDAGLNQILEPLYLKFSDDIVIDPMSSLLGDVASPAAQQYPFSEITRNLPATFFPRARSVEKVKEPPQGTTGVTVTPLIETSPQSWGETDLQSRQVRYDEGKDLKGPRTLAFSVESPAALGSEEQKTAKSTKTRLVVIGNSAFASNSFFGQLGNGDLFLNAVNWLAEDEALISIRPKPPEQRTANVNSANAPIILFSSIIALPLAVLLVGVSVWWRRR